MNRRRFLQILSGVALAPKVSYFFPPVSGWPVSRISSYDYWDIAKYENERNVIAVYRGSSGEHYEFKWIPSYERYFRYFEEAQNAMLMATAIPPKRLGIRSNSEVYDTISRGLRES